MKPAMIHSDTILLSAPPQSNIGRKWIRMVTGIILGSLEHRLLSSWKHSVRLYWDFDHSNSLTSVFSSERKRYWLLTAVFYGKVSRICFDEMIWYVQSQNLLKSLPIMIIPGAVFIEELLRGRVYFTSRHLTGEVPRGTDGTWFWKSLLNYVAWVIWPS